MCFEMATNGAVLSGEVRAMTFPLHPGVQPFHLREIIYFFGVWVFSGWNNNQVQHGTRREEGRRCSELSAGSGNINSGTMPLRVS